MKKSLLLSLVLLGFAVGLKAAVHTVTLSSDNATTPEAGSLRYFIQNAAKGDIIVFDVDKVNLEASLSISYKTLTIDGGEGVVLDGNRAGRVLSVTFSSSSIVTLRNLTIQNGYLQGETSPMGGGIYATSSGDRSGLLVENCIFRDNEVASNFAGKGGALWTKGGTFINCTFFDNSVSGIGPDNSGGAVYAERSLFIGCLFARNSAMKGGGLFATIITDIINCTITQNTTNYGQGSGLYIDYIGYCYNSIIYQNFSGTTQDNLFVNFGSLEFCALDQGYARVGLSGNIGLSASPFVDAPNGDYRLSATSLCVDAGNSDKVVGVTLDLAGNPRITGNAIDMGAYESVLPIIISGTLQSEDGTPLSNYPLHDLITTDVNGQFQIETGQHGIQNFDVLAFNPAPEGHDFYPQELVFDASKDLRITAYEGIVVLEDYAPGSTIVWDSKAVHLFTTINLKSSSLTIAKGTQVKFHGFYGIRVSGKGQLNAVGTADERITFTSGDKTGFQPKDYSKTGAWNRIVFEDMDAEADFSRLVFCVLENSKAVSSYENGGALSVESFNRLVVENCLFQNNSVYHNATPMGAGAILVKNSDINLVNCVFTNNHTGQSNNGGAVGILNYAGNSANIINCTIVNNSAAEEGGGLYVQGGSAGSMPVRIINSIITGNSAAVSGQQISGPFPSVYNSYVEGATSSQFVESVQLLSSGLVFDPAQPGSYTLAESSMCINAGTLQDITDLLPQVDFHGNPRIHQQSIDMGAVERQSNISSLISGKLTNEAGEAMPGIEIYPGITTDGTGHFQITPGTNSIAVGDLLSLTNPPTLFLYPRKLEVPDQQIKEINITAFNNPIVDAYTVLEENNNWEGILNIMVDVHLEDEELHLSPGTILRFFNQSALLVSGTGRIVAGGVPGDSITFTSGNPTHFNLHSSDEASAWGGIRFNNMSNLANTSVLDHCKIEYVKNFWGQGALYIRDFDNIQIKNSLFQHNSGRNGGAIYIYGSKLTIRNTIIRDNGTSPRMSFSANDGGVGIYAERATLNLLGCLLSDNVGFGHGGGLYARYSDVNIVNCHIVNNQYGFPDIPLKSVSNGSSTVNIYNSIIWGNRDGGFNRNITSTTANAVRLYNSCIEGGNAIGTSVYQDCTAENPLFVDAANGDYRLQPASPLINTGMNDLPVELQSGLDLLNKPRRMGKTIDIGAYEHEEITSLIHAPTQFVVGQSLEVQGEVVMGTVTSWSWDFNEDGLEDANGPGATYTYTNAVPDSIRLVVFISEWGINDTVYHAIKLIDKPLAHFTASASAVRRNVAVNFSDASTNEPTQWLWDFGDGQTSTEQNPSHTYTETGQYTVTLSATNLAGTHQHSEQITVYELPVATFSADVLEGDAPLTVSFTNASTNASTFSWDFGDGHTSTEANPEHIYTTSGTYTVRLTAINAYGQNTSQRLDLIKVLKPIPVAYFTVIRPSVRRNEAMTFSDASTKTPTQWLWDFGDGNASTEQHPSHTYTDMGAYTVTLSASNASGTTQYSRTIYVYEIPRSEFSADVVEGFAPLTVTFTNATLYEPISFDWEFGDGSTSTDEHPVYIYTEPGEYSVSLSSRNDWGEGYHMKSRLIKVLPPVSTQLPRVDSHFKVYPNPVGSTLVLEAEKVYHLSVTNVSGQTVWQGSMTDTSHSLNTSAWPSGLYFVRFYNEEESFLLKVVKE